MGVKFSFQCVGRVTEYAELCPSCIGNIAALKTQKRRKMSRSGTIMQSNDWRDTVQVITSESVIRDQCMAMM